MIRKILDKQDIDRILTRIAHEIIEKNRDIENLRIIGIERGGEPVAKALAEKIRSLMSVSVAVGALNISSHRDDRDIRPMKTEAGRSLIPFDVTGKKIILVDDVLFTGRTFRAAMDAIMDYGRPSRIQLCALIDRGHREIPVKPDYVGKNVPTKLSDNIEVRIGQEGFEDAAILETLDE